MKKTELKNLIINLIVVQFFILIGLGALPINSCTKIETVELIKKDTVGANVFDASGNEYGTIIIGLQTWIKSNLRTLKYNGGNQIPTTDINLRSLVNPMFYFSHKLSTDLARDGYYYTWHTIDKICPAGFHVPSLEEWKVLEDYVKGNAKSLASTSGWINCIYETTVGYNQADNNASLFNAYPSGNISAQSYGLSYDNYGYMASYWSSTEGNDELLLSAHIKSIAYDKRLIQSSVYPKNWSFNVRCVKNK